MEVSEAPRRTRSPIAEFAERAEKLTVTFGETREALAEAVRGRYFARAVYFRDGMEGEANELLQLAQLHAELRPFDLTVNRDLYAAVESVANLRGGGAMLGDLHGNLDGGSWTGAIDRAVQTLDGAIASTQSQEEQPEVHPPDRAEYQAKCVSLLDELFDLREELAGFEERQAMADADYFTGHVAKRAEKLRGLAIDYVKLRPADTEISTKLLRGIEQLGNLKGQGQILGLLRRRYGGNFERNVGPAIDALELARHAVMNEGIDPPPLSEEMEATLEAAFHPGVGHATRVEAMQKLEAAIRDPDATVVREEWIGGKHINGVYKVWLSNGVVGIWKPFGRERRQEIRISIPIREQTAREAAAYAVDKALEHLAGAPPTVVRTLDGKRGALSVFVPDAEKVKTVGEPTEARYRALAIFDNVVGNLDRHLGNLLSALGRLIPIDHGLTFPRWNRRHGGSHYEFDQPVALDDHAPLLRALLDSKREGLTEELLLDGISQDAIEAMFERVQVMLTKGRTYAGWRASGWQVASTASLAR
jgi:hypothetical protein